MGVNMRQAPWGEAAAQAETRRTVARAGEALLAHGSKGAKRRRRYGRTAGVLFVVAALATFPVALAYDESSRWAVYVMTIVAVCSGLISLALPWERIPPFSLHVLPIAAVPEITDV